MATKRKYNTLTRLELQKCSKEELINKIFEIRDRTQHPQKKRKKKSRYLNLGCFQRHMAFKVAYLGKDFAGFQIQENTSNTVSENIFKALTKCKLIEDISKANFAVCGRTDKGVSSYGNVFSVLVKTRIPEGRGILKPIQGEESKVNVDYVEPHKVEAITNGAAKKGEHGKTDAPAADVHPEKVEVPGEEATKDLNQLEQSSKKDEWSKTGSPDAFHGMDNAISTTIPSKNLEKAKVKKPAKEIDYVKILNYHLPPTIRILASAPVDLDFSPRHRCVLRSYRYFFFRGKMDLTRIGKAAALVKGAHDFRNFSKIDVVSMMTWERTVYDSKVVEVDHPSVGEEQLCYYEIKGDGFLWHMVRNICAILFRVGLGKEEPNIVSKLLDIKTHPCKPLYNMVDSDPLVLWDCHFPKDVLEFPESSERITEELKQLMQVSRIRSAIIKSFYDSTKPTTPSSIREDPYNPLFTGKCEESVEKKIEKLTGNRKKNYLLKKKRFDHYNSGNGKSIPEIMKAGF